MTFHFICADSCDTNNAYKHTNTHLSGGQHCLICVSISFIKIISACSSKREGHTTFHLVLMIVKVSRR